MRRGAKGTEVTVSRLGRKSGECCVAEAKGIKKEWATMSNVVGFFDIEVFRLVTLRRLVPVEWWRQIWLECVEAKIEK